MHRLKMREAVEICAYLRQFDLSADRALLDQWEKLLQFYAENDRLLGLRQVRLSVEGRAESPHAHLENLTAHDLLGPAKRLGMFARQIAGAMTRTAFLADMELKFIGLALGRAVHLLSLPARPESEEIIEARSLSFGAHCLLSSIVFPWHFKNAERIEHFNAAPHVEVLTLVEVLDRAR